MMLIQRVAGRRLCLYTNGRKSFVMNEQKETVSLYRHAKAELNTDSVSNAPNTRTHTEAAHRHTQKRFTETPLVGHSGKTHH